MGRDTNAILVRLAEALPSSTEMAAGEDIDIQARAALALLVERALGLSETAFVAVSCDPSTCPNCEAACTSPRSPYCSCECREESGFVRQVRSALASGVAFDLEKQATLGQNLWRLLGGGFPRRQRLVTDKERARLFKRNEGKCETCGASATTFDHLGSG